MLQLSLVLGIASLPAGAASARHVPRIEARGNGVYVDE
jgi:hypothetical protein